MSGEFMPELSKVKNRYCTKEEGPRPAGDPDKCFYCHVKIGEHHETSCVIPQRKVRLKITLEVDTWEPWTWGKESIDFHKNESSWCQDNLVDLIDDHIENQEGCLCGKAKIEYVGEAE